MKYAFHIITLLAFAMSPAYCQKTILGSVIDGDNRQGIPYAAVHLMNTCIGASCNESGQFALHVPKEMEDALVIISAMGYRPDTVAVQTLARNDGKVRLQPSPLQLDAVTVVEYSSARKLMDAVVQRIPQNYRNEEAVGIWYYRNRQMLNDSLFVKSEGLIRNYMPAYGTMLSMNLYYGQDSAEWNEELYRVYQTLDTVMVYNKEYWRSLIGPEFLDDKLKLQRYSKPSDCIGSVGTDFVNYMRKKNLRMFSKKSKYTMERFSQGGKDYYRITVAFMPKGQDYCDTAIMVIDREELAIVDAVVIQPSMSFRPHLLIKKWYTDMLSSSRTHWRYYKYNGRYQLDFIRQEYEYQFYFSQETVEAGCNTSSLRIKGMEECILSEFTHEDVEDYKHRYYDNKHPRTKENLEETERILRQPHNKIPW